MGPRGPEAFKGVPLVAEGEAWEGLQHATGKHCRSIGTVGGEVTTP